MTRDLIFHDFLLTVQPGKINFPRGIRESVEGSLSRSPSVPFQMHIPNIEKLRPQPPIATECVIKPHYSPFKHTTSQLFQRELFFFNLSPKPLYHISALQTVVFPSLSTSNRPPQN
jgi:hypothetical protein